MEEELEEINAGSDFIYEQSGATIKCLIKENQQLKQKLLEYQEQSIRDNQNWIAETTELQQQLHDLPKKIVEEIKNLSIFDFEAFEESKIRIYRITETALDTILKNNM